MLGFECLTERPAIDRGASGLPLRPGTRRAAGFHHMDRVINMAFHSVRVNWMLEMTGPLLILMSGVLHLRPSAKPEETEPRTWSGH